MANKTNHRRKGQRRSENATHHGCGSKRDHARGRSRWKRVVARQYRRIEKSGTVRKGGKLMTNTVHLRLFRDEVDGPTRPARKPERPRLERELAKTLTQQQAARQRLDGVARDDPQYDNYYRAWTEALLEANRLRSRLSGYRKPRVRKG